MRLSRSPRDPRVAGRTSGRSSSSSSRPYRSICCCRALSRCSLHGAPYNPRAGRSAILVLLFEVASSVCLWEVDRIALGFKGWFPVACSQLAGNALGRIVPGSAPPFTVVMLRRAGFDGGDAAAALTASTGLQIATALALP